jgi:hypothetical protein
VRNNDKEIKVAKERTKIQGAEKAFEEQEVAGKIKRIVVKPLKIKEFGLSIDGTAGLLVKSIPDDVLQQLDAKYRNKFTKAETKAQRQDKSVPSQTREEECEDCLYKIPGQEGKYGVPISALKKCLIAAGKPLGLYQTLLNQAVFIVNPNGHWLIPLDGKPKWHMDERPVMGGKFPNLAPCLRFRPMFDKWSITFKIKYREDMISAEDIVNLYEQAGFSVGLCEYRPEKGGDLGTFRVRRG